MTNMIRVGMADFKICRAPDHILTLGLGSCIGVVIYDIQKQLCGMAHIMLPDSKKINQNDNRFKFVDTCLSDMYQELIYHGADPKKLVAKIAGGARMFAYDVDNEHLNIGGKNIKATKDFLTSKNIPILAEDTGAFYGRTIEFYPETGQLCVKAVGKGTHII